MTLSLDTAYRSFGGEVEASSTPTICRPPDSRRHQLWAIALANPMSVPEIAPTTSEFEGIKALFSGTVDATRKLALIQPFDKRKIIAKKGLSLFHASNVYRKVEGVGLTLDARLAAILEDKKLSFFSFFAARQIFDLTQY